MSLVVVAFLFDFVSQVFCCCCFQKNLAALQQKVIKKKNHHGIELLVICDGVTLKNKVSLISLSVIL